MFTFISVYSMVLPIASLIITKCWLVSVAHDGNEHKSRLYLSISTVYTMSMQFHFRIEFLLGHKPKVKCTHQTGDEFNPEFVTTHQHKMISQALVYSKENLDVKSGVV